jgi:hypothetical protein
MTRPASSIPTTNGAGMGDTDVSGFPLFSMETVVVWNTVGIGMEVGDVAGVPDGSGATGDGLAVGGRVVAVGEGDGVRDGEGAGDRVAVAVEVGDGSTPGRRIGPGGGGGPTGKGPSCVAVGEGVTAAVGDSPCAARGPGLMVNKANASSHATARDMEASCLG